MNFEQLVLASRNTGSEVGDINHSSDFPPRVVDESNQLLCQQLVDYMMDDKIGFFLLFSVIEDKDHPIFSSIWDVYFHMFIQSFHVLYNYILKSCNEIVWFLVKSQSVNGNGSSWKTFYPHVDEDL